MNSSEEQLNVVLANETNRLKFSYPSENVIFGLVEIIRSLDYHSLTLEQNLREGDAALMEKYKYGWASAFKILYPRLSLGDVPLFPSLKESCEWADSTIQHGGSIQMCYQMLDYVKADLMKLNSNGEKDFEFEMTGFPAEYYEGLSLDYYFSLMNGVLAEKSKALCTELPAMRQNLESIVSLMFGEFISYRATDEIDEYYRRFGYLYLMTTQVVEEFDEGDKFGDYLYKDYLDIAEYICRAAIMHKDCCMALSKKTNHKVNLRNILSYGFSLSSFISSLSDYLGWSEKKLYEILSCFVLNQENYLHHLSYPKAPAAPYFAIGKDTWMRSSFGSLDKPVFFLNRELKRKYPKDYFNAVNNRESRFKHQLYSFFELEKIIKVQENVIIKIGNDSTDIDAIIFDKDRNILGLFQLKWQDTFYSSMKERFSRMSNLVPKSVEWIDKVTNWIKSTEAKTILNTLKIDKKYDKIEDIYLFVIVRNHTHFTNQKLDDRAVWASWYQVIEASAKVKDKLCTNPIAEFAAKLKFFSPLYRRLVEGNAIFHDYQLKFSNHTVSVKGK